MKIRELTFELRQKSEPRVGKCLETLGLFSCRAMKSVQVYENGAVGDFGLEKEFANC
jgi:hypothetical protein